MANWQGNNTQIPAIPQISSIAGRVSTLEFNFSSLSSFVTLSSLNTRVSTLETQVSSLRNANFSSSVSTLGISSLVTLNISSLVGDVTFLSLSTLRFNPQFSNLVGSFSPKIDLGMGGFFGNLLGQLGSGALTLGLGGAALATGIASIAMPRGYNQINNGVFETVNGTTQLQVSTLGFQFPLYSTIFRTVSSIKPDQVPGREIFVSSFFQPGTLCIRSISDPLDLPVDVYKGSTIQSFSQWVPIPISISSSATSTPVITNNPIFSTVTIASNLTAQNAIFSTLTVSSLNIMQSTITTFSTSIIDNLQVTDFLRFPLSTTSRDSLGNVPNFYQFTDVSTFQIGYAAAPIAYPHVTLDRHGRVGVREERPRASLHVNGTARFSTLQLSHSTDSNQPSIRTSYLNPSTNTTVNQYVFQNTYSRFTTPAGEPLSAFPSTWNTEAEPTGYWNNQTLIHDNASVPYTIELVGYNNSGSITIVNPPGASTITWKWLPNNPIPQSTLITPAGRTDTVTWTGNTISLSSNAQPARPVTSNALTLSANESGHFLTTSGNAPTGGSLSVQAPLQITNLRSMQSLVRIGNSDGTASSNIFTAPILVNIQTAANLSNDDGVVTCSVTQPLKRPLGSTSNQTFFANDWYPLVCFSGWTSGGTSYAMNAVTMNAVLQTTSTGQIWAVNCIATTNALPAQANQATVTFYGSAIMYPAGVFLTG